MTAHVPLAAVLMDQGAEPATLRAAVDAARGAGARPIVLVLPRGAEAPADTRVVHVNDGARTISALRAGMALLTNTTARLALVWPLGAGQASVPADAVLALVSAARDSGAAVTALADDDLERAPIVIARDAWLDLVTIGEQGMAAVATRRGLHLVGA